MKVIVAINGSITAESMAFYAIKYAQVEKYTIVLLHIENFKDNIDDVKASVNRISTLALAQKVAIEYIILKGQIKSVIKTFLSNNNTDIIFCSTRKNKSFITNSFSELLIKMNLGVDIAIARIVKISNIIDINTIMLSIKEDKLSVKKFTFFSTIASAYKADAEIYSVSNMSKWKFSKVDIHQARQKLGTINYNLRHYTKLANFMPFKMRIKHDFTSTGIESLLTRIVKSNTQLVVIGARRLSVKSFFKKEIPIEKLMREASVNIIAYYPSRN